MANNYSKVHINLLPQEMLPGPSVRLGMLFNVLVIAATVSYLLVDSVMSLNRLGNLKADNEIKKKLIAQGEQTEQFYNNLIGIEESVNQYGRLISMASVDYAEMPLLMTRLAQILPDGVYVKSVTNDRPKEGNTNTLLRFQLTASQDDPALLIKTLEAFKKDEFFSDCYMSDAEYKQESLADRLPQFGINWLGNDSAETDDGALEGPAGLNANLIDFQIQALVKRPLVTDGLPRLMDDSEVLSKIKFLTPPAVDKDGNPIEDTGGASGAAAAEAEADEASPRPAAGGGANATPGEAS